MAWHVVGVATPNLSVLRSNHVYGIHVLLTSRFQPPTVEQI